MQELNATIQELRLELARSKSQRRKFGLLLIISLLSPSLFIFIGASSIRDDQIIKTHILAITDKFGKERILLQCLDDGAPSFVMYDSNHKVRLGFRVFPEGQAQIDLLDKEEAERLVFQVESNGTSKTIYFDEHDNPTILLESNSLKNTNGLMFYKNNTLLGSFYFDINGDQGIGVNGSKGKGKAFLGRDLDGNPMIGIANNEGRTPLLQSLDKNGQTFIELRDPTATVIKQTLPQE